MPGEGVKAGAASNARTRAHARAFITHLPSPPHLGRLPDFLTAAICDRVDDDKAEVERIGDRWRQVLPRMAATAERIRAQVRERRCRCYLTPESVTSDGRCGR